MHGPSVVPLQTGMPRTLRCLGEVGVEDAEILKPPGKKKGWLVKGVVPGASGIGVVAILIDRLRRTRS